MKTVKVIPFSIALFVIGAVFVLLSLAGGVVIGGYSLAFQESWTRLIASIFGIVFVGLAIFIELDSRKRRKRTDISVIQTDSVKRDQQGNLEHLSQTLEDQMVNSLNRKYGVAQFYNMQNSDERNQRNGDTRNLIVDGNIFSLLALSAASYIDPGIKRHWDYLQAKLDNGASLQILLMDPFHKEKRCRDKLNGISTAFDPKFRFDLLVNLYNRYPNANIRVTAQNIYCSLFFSEKEMIYDPYHLGKIGDRLENNFFALKLKNLENQDCYYRVLKKHFEYLWSTSDDFETFVDHQLSNLVIPYKKIEVKSRTAK